MPCGREAGLNLKVERGRIVIRSLEPSWVLDRIRRKKGGTL